MEELNDVKANKADVVMTTDLEALLTAHAAELDQHLDALKDEILRVVSMKADKEEMATLDAKLGARISSLENAILKGLKAISDKVRTWLASVDLGRAGWGACVQQPGRAWPAPGYEGNRGRGLGICRIGQGHSRVLAWKGWTGKGAAHA